VHICHAQYSDSGHRDELRGLHLVQFKKFISFLELS
jgi:hypothetical protein